MSDTITVGQVSGIIAAGIFFVQFLLPNLIVLILAGILDDTNSAVTWSVAGGLFQSSLFPTLLRAESVSLHGVVTSVNIVSFIRPTALFLIAVAAIVTPLGLGDGFSPAKRPTLVPFTYLPDLSSMGVGTMPRTNLSFIRSCDTNSSTCDYTPPGDRQPLFQSGLSHQNATVSSFFDIQYRRYTWKNDDWYGKQVNKSNAAKDYAAGLFRQVTSLVLNDAIEPVEGLIVDTKNGGVGFRNHTAPQGLSNAAEWDEDILFIEPETVCVDTNITLEFMLHPKRSGEPDSTGTTAHTTLVDQGGFVNINHALPSFSTDDNQANARLQERAYAAAWMLNTLTMIHMNLTAPPPKLFSYATSTLGRKFPVGAQYSHNFESFQAGTKWDSLFSAPYVMSNSSSYLGNYTTVGNTSYPSYPGMTYVDENGLYHGTSYANSTDWPNPFGIGPANFTQLEHICEGRLGTSPDDLFKPAGYYVPPLIANMSGIAVSCGLTYGAAHRRDGGRSIDLESGTWWTQPIYTCASASKALIKTVRFRYNSTSHTPSLRDLHVLDLEDKSYASESDKPVWGVDRLNVSYHYLTPLWGLISGDRKHDPSISTVQSERLYLPGWSIFGLANDVTQQNSPALDAPADAMKSVYDPPFESNSHFIDYTGTTNIAMLDKWQTFSRSANSTRKIINLIWTDMLANSILGTRGWIPSPAHPSKSSDPIPDYGPAMVPVILYHHRVRYNWLFFIPAAITLFCLLLAAVTAILLAILGHARPARVRHFLTHTSSGRIFTHFLYPGACNSDARTRPWIDAVGGRKIRLLSDGDAQWVEGTSPSSSSTPPSEKASLLPNSESSLQQEETVAVRALQESPK